MVRRTVVALAALALLAVPVPAYAAVPGPPASVAAALGAGRARVTWTPAADDGGVTATGYDVYRVADGGAPQLLATVGADARSYYDAAAPPGPELSYGVAQRNADGAGPAAYTAPERSPVGELVVSGFAGPGWESRRLVDAQVPGPGPRFPVSDEPDRDAEDGAPSPDGARVAYAKADASGNWDIWVRAAHGAGPERRLTISSKHDSAPVWSPDGRLIAFLRGWENTWVVPAAGGEATEVRGVAMWPAWLSDSRSLLMLDGSQWRVLKVTLGVPGYTVVPGTKDAEHLAVSPNGRWLAFTHTATGGRRSVAVMPVTGSSPPKVFADPAADVFDPTWRGDGRGLYANRVLDSDDDTAYEVAAYSWDGTTLARTAAAVTDGVADRDPAYRAIGLGFTSAPHATRSTATITFDVAAPYATVTCRLDGGAPADCSSGTWTRSGLAAGRHTLYVTASRPGFPGRVLAHTWTVDLSPPVLTLPEPPRETTLSWAWFRYSGRDDGSGVASYDVRYRRARYDTGFGGYWTPNAWQGQTQEFAYVDDPDPGYEYCFSVRARDRLGNRSAWSAERCDAAPADDPSFTASAGWTRVKASGYYEGTYTGTQLRGARLTLGGVAAHTLTLVAMRCPTCGTVDVFHAGAKVATFDLTAPVTERRVRLGTPWSPSLRSGPVTVVVTSAGQTVRIDGLAAFRK